MREAEKKRLVRLIGEAKAMEASGIGRVTDECIAEHLLDNGIIVPPCKVGDVVYKIVDMSHTACNSFITKETVEPYAVIHANVMGGYSCIPFEAFGKTVFLSEEEAEYVKKLRRSVSLVNGHIEE